MLQNLRDHTSSLLRHHSGSIFSQPLNYSQLNNQAYCSNGIWQHQNQHRGIHNLNYNHVNLSPEMDNCDTSLFVPLPLPHNQLLHDRLHHLGQQDKIHYNSGPGPSMLLTKVPHYLYFYLVQMTLSYIYPKLN